jgi:hypothetical protein
MSFQLGHALLKGPVIFFVARPVGNLACLAAVVPEKAKVSFRRSKMITRKPTPQEVRLFGMEGVEFKKYRVVIPSKANIMLYASIQC